MRWRLRRRGTSNEKARRREPAGFETCLAGVLPSREIVNALYGPQPIHEAEALAKAIIEAVEKRDEMGAGSVCLLCQTAFKMHYGLEDRAVEALDLLRRSRSLVASLTSLPCPL